MDSDFVDNFKEKASKKERFVISEFDGDTKQLAKKNKFATS